MSKTSYYRHATLGEIGKLLALTGRLVMAVVTRNGKRRNATAQRAEDVHARITARRDGARNEADH